MWKTIVAALIVLVASCAVPEDQPIPGVEVQIAQARIDMARGKMSIRVINHTGEPLAVSAAGYSDERLAASPQWSGEMPVPAGRTRDLRVDVPDFSCADPESVQPPTAELTIIPVDGEPVTGRYATTEVLDFISQTERTECFEKLITAHGAIVLGELDPSADVAELPVVVVNTDAELIEVHSVQRTVILQPADAGIAWPLDAAVPAGEEAMPLMRLQPTRCDDHALAEDKAGTRFAITAAITVDGQRQEGTVVVWSTPHQKGQIFDWIRRWCATA